MPNFDINWFNERDTQISPVNEKMTYARTGLNEVVVPTSEFKNNINNYTKGLTQKEREQILQEISAYGDFDNTSPAGTTAYDSFDSSGNMPKYGGVNKSLEKQPYIPNAEQLTKEELKEWFTDAQYDVKGAKELYGITNPFTELDTEAAGKIQIYLADETIIIAQESKNQAYAIPLEFMKKYMNLEKDGKNPSIMDMVQDMFEYMTGKDSTMIGQVLTEEQQKTVEYTVGGFYYNSILKERYESENSVSGESPYTDFFMETPTSDGYTIN